MQQPVNVYCDHTDEELFARIEQGDEEAFSQVYNKYHKLLYVLSYRYLMNAEMAEDAVQHVFTRLWEFRSELRVGVSLKNFLFTMTKNHILNIIRNENNALTKNYEMAQAEPGIEDNLIEKFEKKELMSLSYKALDKLLPQKRDICLMKVRDELTNQEIADKLKLSINTIKTHHSDALKLLRVYLGKILMNEAAWNIRYTLTSENTILEKVLQDLEKIAPVRFRYDVVKKEVLVTMKEDVKNG